MSRLIEVRRVEDCASPLKIRVGDVLMLAASGARLQVGDDAVELSGPFQSAVVGTTGEVMTPEGPPNAVLVRGRQPGLATIDVFAGESFRASRPSTLTVAVE